MRKGARESTFLARFEARAPENVAGWPQHRPFLTHVRAMSLQQLNGVPRISLNDQSPGAPLEAWRLPTGAAGLLMPIVGDPQLPAQVALVLRCEPRGEIFVAIGLASAEDSGPA
jgi:hypothetical protein